MNKSGFPYYEAANGVEAVEAFKTTSLPFDIVLMGKSHPFVRLPAIL